MPFHARRPSKTRPRRDGQNGGAVVEFAIVLPIFLALLFGAIDYGWYFYQKFTLASAVQAGVRSALSVREIDRPDPWTTAREAAKTNLSSSGAIAPSSVAWGPVDNADATLAADPADYGGVKPNRYIIFTATYTFIPLVGLVRVPNSMMTYSISMVLDAQNANI
jgi:Flp pilus assembly protein TadG